ncbi:MAG: UDP-N-acetylglucosamine 1-carboxyvinyltransferase [Candidatus Puniceispirillales bacterium]
MDKLIIEGGHRLEGRIPVSGAKNAALPLMAACLMAETPMLLDNLPPLADTDAMLTLLDHLGVSSRRDGESVIFEPPQTITTTAPYDIVRRMRASVLVLGPLLARTGEATVSLPGGCAIGTRPVDLHIMVMERLGAEVTLLDGYMRAAAPKGLKGASITFPMVSVGATENALMAAALAAGETVIHNAAREPEIVDLADCLNAMGAQISGHGTATITITGVASLKGCTHRVVADRIEAGTFAIAAAMTRGHVTLEHCHGEHLEALFAIMGEAGISISTDADSITIKADAAPRPMDITTAPYPGFPTDLQAQFMAMMCLAEGDSQISETIFENRFMHVPELMRMGARIDVSGGMATVHGGTPLKAAPVMATDLRASVSLVLAGLVAEGRTEISRIYHLDRGYDRLEEKLSACGASIHRIRSEG